MELNEQQFITGFNNGYLLAQYEPEILNTMLSKINPVNSYIAGMNYGKQEYEIEQQANQLDDLGKLRNKGKENREFELD
jgi:hypothetical protein